MSEEDGISGLASICVLIAALLAGTACSLTSKVMLTMKSTGMTQEVENFSYPLFQTFGMFIGMTFGLVIHLLVKICKIPFPGYIHHVSPNELLEIETKLPPWIYFLIIVPSIFDLIATALCMIGLLYVNVSIYQMLRGSAIVFVALLKQTVFGYKLFRYQWLGIILNVVAIILVGMTALLDSDRPLIYEDISVSTKRNPVYGVLYILAGAIVQSLQYAFEEKIMKMNISAPPMLLVGMEGLWGSILCLFILYPIAYLSKGEDHGSIENPYNTYIMIYNSSEIQMVFLLYFLTVLAYNVLGILVTYMLSSIWHAILDNFRPISVWSTDMFIYYYISTNLGESWTKYSWIQLIGLAILLYGTAIYNGTIKLTGGIESLYIFEFSKEYQTTYNSSNRTNISSISEITPMLKDDSIRTINNEVLSPHLTTLRPFMSPAKTKYIDEIDNRYTPIGLEIMNSLKKSQKSQSFA